MQKDDSTLLSTVRIRRFHHTQEELQQCQNVTRSVFKEYGQPEEAINELIIE